jgi:hypothetical protein
MNSTYRRRGKRQKISVVITTTTGMSKGILPNALTASMLILSQGD